MQIKSADFAVSGVKDERMSGFVPTGSVLRTVRKGCLLGH